MSKKVRDCLFAIVCVAIIFCLLGFCWTSEREYKRDVVVVSINENTIHCVDVVGNEWMFESDDEYHIDEPLVLCMHDNGTEGTITDDVIQEVERMS
jgi:hypothetical protein